MMYDQLLWGTTSRDVTVQLLIVELNVGFKPALFSSEQNQKRTEDS